MGMKRGAEKRATALLTSEAGRFSRIERRLRSGGANFEELRGTVAGVSASTLKRDLKSMREELGAPIAYDRTCEQYRLTAEWSGIAAVLLEQLGALS